MQHGLSVCAEAAEHPLLMRCMLSASPPLHAKCRAASMAMLSTCLQQAVQPLAIFLQTSISMVLLTDNTFQRSWSLVLQLQMTPEFDSMNCAEVWELGAEGGLAPHSPSCNHDAQLLQQTGRRLSSVSRLRGAVDVGRMAGEGGLL